MIQDRAQHQPMPWRQVAVHGSLQHLARTLELAPAKHRKLRGRAARNQTFDHLARTDAINVGDNATQFDPRVIEDLVQPVLFASQGLRQLAAISRYDTEFTQILRWNEAATQQAKTCQLRQPF